MLFALQVFRWVSSAEEGRESAHSEHKHGHTECSQNGGNCQSSILCYVSIEGSLSILGSSPHCWLTWVHCHESLKSLLHKWMLTPSSDRWFYGLGQAWPSFQPSVLFLMAHKLVLKAIFCALAFERIREGQEVYRITELWGPKQRNI